MKPTKINYHVFACFRHAKVFKRKLSGIWDMQNVCCTGFSYSTLYKHLNLLLRSIKYKHLNLLLHSIKYLHGRIK